ncbi:MAG: Lrp/AsnC family transcriptional regulator [Candidatus Geothermarchaeales archaeon]
MFVMLDETDIKILRVLQENVRSSYREIARRAGVSVGTALSRIKNLERRGVIRGYGVVLDPEKLGYAIVAIIEVVVSKGKLLEVEREVAKSPNVYGVYDVTGESDAIVIARFKQRQELSRFIKSILAMEFVERTITHVVLNTMKEDFRVVL